MSRLLPRLLPFAMVVAASSHASPAQEVRVVGEDLRGVLLVVETPSPGLAPHAAQPGRVEPRIPGCPALAEEGRPVLPFSRSLIAVPVGTRPVLTVTAAPERRVSDAAAAVRLRPGFGPAEEEGWEEAPAPPLPPGRHPRRAAEVAWTGWMRGLHVAEVRFYPVRSAGPEGGLIHHPRIEARVEFVPDPSATNPRGAAAAGAPVRPDALTDLARKVVVNPSQIPSAGAAESPSASADAGGIKSEASILTSPAPLKLTVNRDGLYAVDPNRLAAAGVDPNSVNPQDFRIEVGGSPVAVEVLGESDGQFDPGDRLVFYGKAATGPFTRNNVYWLHFDGASPRAASRDGSYGSPAPTPASFLTTVHEEQDLVYTQQVPPGAIDHWWWKLQRAGTSTADTSYTVALPNVDPSTHTATVRVNLQGRTSIPSVNPDHHTRIFLNNTQIDDRTWDGQTQLTHSVSVSSSLLVAGNNTIRVLLVGDTGAVADEVYVNFLEMDYRRTYAASADALVADGEGTGDLRFSMTGFSSSQIFLYDATDPNALVRITVPPGQVTGAGPFTIGFQDNLASDRVYAAATAAGMSAPASVVQDVPSTLQSAANGADYIAIGPPEFMTALGPLLSLRASQGYRVLAAATDDIYDEFNFGVFDPGAIKSFLAYAYANYQPPAPEFVVLVGDGHFDYRDNLGSGVKQFVPPIFVNISTFGETPSDNEYVAVAGADVLPDMIVGRLPVRTAAEVTTLADKILGYETSPPIAALNAQSLFVADNDDVNFEAILGSLASLIPPSMSATTVYMSQVGCVFNPSSCPTCTAARTAIKSNLESGAFMTTFLGHGSATQWACECSWASSNVSPCFSSDPNNLVLNDNVTFVAALNCINGYFVDLVQAGSGHINFSLAEHMVRQARRGAIVMWAPAALGTTSDYGSIADWLFREVFIDLAGVVGRAATTAVVAAVTQPFNPADMDNVRELVLFGDPATNLALDSDADGLLDRAEQAGGTDPLDGDSDDDGVADGAETPLASDADADGAIDALDPDADGDCIYDGTERGVTSPVPGTDASAGFFVPDADPLTTTDPLDPDSDGGGASDGAEDRDFDGASGPGETDPSASGDDAPLVEVTNLTIDTSGGDVVLAWDPAGPDHPCVMYKVYVADDNPAPKNSFAQFHLLAVTSASGYTHAGAAVDGMDHDYLVLAFDPLEGPLGHYGR